MAVSAVTVEDRQRAFVLVGMFSSLLVLIAFTQLTMLQEDGVSSDVVGTSAARLASGMIPCWIAATGFSLLPTKCFTMFVRGTCAAVGIAVVAAMTRVALQGALGVYGSWTWSERWAELWIGFAVSLAVLMLTFGWMYGFSRQRATEIEVQEARRRGMIALRALREEENRVQHAVADSLHGTLQQRLVILGARIRDVRDGTRDTDVARQLDGLIADLDLVREETVRATSHLMAPDGLEVGLGAAVRVLLARLPSSVRYDLQIEPSVNDLESIDPQEGARPVRMLAVRVVEEAITNAIRHGKAGSLRVMLEVRREPIGGVRDRRLDIGELSFFPRSRTVDLGGKYLRLVVDNDGYPFDVAAAEMSGITRLRERVDLLGGFLDITSDPASSQEFRTSVVAGLPLL